LTTGVREVVAQPKSSSAGSRRVSKRIISGDFGRDAPDVDQDDGFRPGDHGRLQRSLPRLPFNVAGFEIPFF